MKYWLIPLAMACGLAVCATVADAREPRSSASGGAPSSLEQAVKQVQRQTHGHILAADTIQRGQTKVYRIKVLTPDGQMRVMQLNSGAPAPAQSGKHRSDQGGH